MRAFRFDLRDPPSDSEGPGVWTVVPVTYRKSESESREVTYWISAVDSVLRVFYALDPGDYLASIQVRLASQVPPGEAFAEKFKDAKSDFASELEAHAVLLGSLEWLFAHLAAQEEAPDCPAAWLLDYDQAELLAAAEALVTFARARDQLARVATEAGHPEDAARFAGEWRARAAHLFGETDPPRSREELSELAAVLAQLFVRFRDGQAELHGYKHGLRLRAGPYGIGFGTSAATWQFGTHFLEEEAVEGATGHKCLTRHAVSFDPSTEIVSLAVVARLLSGAHRAGRRRAGLAADLLTPIVEPGNLANLYPRQRFAGFARSLSPPTREVIDAFKRWHRNLKRDGGS